MQFENLLNAFLVSLSTQIIVDDDDSKVWSIYDAGPKNIRCPIIFLPPVSGTADVFFQQILALTGWGYRVISLQYPVYWDLLEFCDGFRKLLDHLQLDKIHLFGASLGGFLAQKFAEYTHKSPRVHSLILCNSFSDTSIFNQTWTANRYWWYVCTVQIIVPLKILMLCVQSYLRRFDQYVDELLSSHGTVNDN
uniref:Maspardin n=1 Tax=Erpetoichthys calabaricus TaxID=27687 RepID=A0A8C4XEN2_ERPCA